MGNSWSYVPNDHYKSANELVQMLLKIISRGGNFLLNIGPSPEGDWSDTAYSRLKEIGVWMKVHADGVYNTIPLPPYQDNNIIYLQSKDKKSTYVYVLSDASGPVILPRTLWIKKIAVNKGSRIVLLDAPGIKIRWQTKDDGIVIDVPSKLTNGAAGKYAIAFKITD